MSNVSINPSFGAVQSSIREQALAYERKEDLEDRAQLLEQHENIDERLDELEKLRSEKNAKAHHDELSQFNVEGTDLFSLDRGTYLSRIVASKDPI